MSAPANERDLPGRASRTRRARLAPNLFERFLGIGALTLLIALIAAVLRGRRDWAEVPLLIWLHLATIALALFLAPLILLRRRGERLHRLLGWGWATAMLLTALISLGIRLNSPGQLSWIHLLSGLTLTVVPAIVLTARAHRVDAHRNFATWTVFGALLAAGFFTFPFDRLLGRWLFG